MINSKKKIIVYLNLFQQQIRLFFSKNITNERIELSSLAVHDNLQISKLTFNIQGKYKNPNYHDVTGKSTQMYSLRMFR